MNLVSCALVFFFCQSLIQLSVGAVRSINPRWDPYYDLRSDAIDEDDQSSNDPEPVGIDKNKEPDQLGMMHSENYDDSYQLGKITNGNEKDIYHYDNGMIMNDNVHMSATKTPPTIFTPATLPTMPILPIMPNYDPLSPFVSSPDDKKEDFSAAGILASIVGDGSDCKCSAVSALKQAARYIIKIQKLVHSNVIKGSPKLKALTKAISDIVGSDEILTLLSDGFLTSWHHPPPSQPPQPQPNQPQIFVIQIPSSLGQYSGEQPPPNQLLPQWLQLPVQPQQPLVQPLPNQLPPQWQQPPRNPPQQKLLQPVSNQYPTVLQPVPNQLPSVLQPVPNQLPQVYQQFPFNGTQPSVVQQPSNVYAPQWQRPNNVTQQPLDQQVPKKLSNWQQPPPNQIQQPVVQQRPNQYLPQPQQPSSGQPQQPLVQPQPPSEWQQWSKPWQQPQYNNQPQQSLVQQSTDPPPPQQPQPSSGQPQQPLVQQQPPSEWQQWSKPWQQPHSINQPQQSLVQQSTDPPPPQWQQPPNTARQNVQQPQQDRVLKVKAF